MTSKPTFWQTLFFSWRETEALTKANAAAILRAEDAHNSVLADLELAQRKIAQLEAFQDKMLKWLNELTEGYNKQVVAYNSMLSHQHSLSQEVYRLGRLVMGSNWKASAPESKRVH